MEVKGSSQNLDQWTFRLSNQNLGRPWGEKNSEFSLTKITSAKWWAPDLFYKLKLHDFCNRKLRVSSPRLWKRVRSPQKYLKSLRNRITMFEQGKNNSLIIFCLNQVDSKPAWAQVFSSSAGLYNALALVESIMQAGINLADCSRQQTNSPHYIKGINTILDARKDDQSTAIGCKRLRFTFLRRWCKVIKVRTQPALREWPHL